jgi:hypothetical protein
VIYCFQLLLSNSTCAATRRQEDPGRAVQVASIKTRAETSARPWLQHLKLDYHELLSNFAFNFSLHRYTQATDYSAWDLWTPSDDEVGRGRYRSPRHRMPYNSRNEGLKCVSMTWRVVFAGPCSADDPWMQYTPNNPAFKAGAYTRPLFDLT